MSHKSKEDTQPHGTVRKGKPMTPSQMAWEARLHTDNGLVQELLIACSAEWSEGFSEDGYEVTLRELKTTPIGRALMRIVEDTLDKADKESTMQ